MPICQHTHRQSHTLQSACSNTSLKLYDASSFFFKYCSSKSVFLCFFKHVKCYRCFGHHFTSCSINGIVFFCVIWLQTSLNIEKLFTKFSLPTTRPCAQQFNSHPNRADATCHTCHGFNSCATTLATRVSQERHFVTRCTTT